MLTPDQGRMWLRITLMMLALGGGIAVLEPRGSPSWTLAIGAAVIGLLGLIITVVLIRRSQ